MSYTEYVRKIPEAYRESNLHIPTNDHPSIKNVAESRLSGRYRGL